MGRIKRSVQATYNTQVNYMSAQMFASAGNLTGTTSDLAPGDNDGMQLLEQKAASQAAARSQPNKNILFVRSDKKPDDVDPEKVENPAEIELDDDDDDDDDEDDEVTEEGEKDDVIIRQAVPDEVFGGVKAPQEE